MWQRFASLIILAVGIVAGVVCYKVPLTEGLDISGGIHMVVEAEDTDKVKVFATTPTYYDYNWTVRGNLDPALAEKIKQAFLDLDPSKPRDKAILDLQAASRFIETKPENYKGIEESARAAGLLK